MKISKQDVLHGSSLLKDEAVMLRRHFHMFPELSFSEFNTADFIEGYLKKHGIEFTKNIAGPGIIARIDGLLEGSNTIAIRAEMDALPINESGNKVYISKIPGIMHACGHDANMAILLCVARFISENRGKFGGRVLFIFQPGEEKSPGGAKLLIESGVLNHTKPDIFIAQHVLPELETGRVGYKKGLYMASCDEIYITIYGRGGHAALTSLTTDQIMIASKLIVNLKESVSARQAANNVPTVFSIGKIIGNGATNVIPEMVDIAGTFRTFDEKWRSEALNLIKAISAETASLHGIKIDVKIAEGYPVLFNDEEITEKAVELSRNLLGNENVELFSELRMSSDDFSFYSTLAPSLYYRIGIKEKGEEMKKLHTSEFDIDEECLLTGIRNMTWIALNLLDENSGLA